MTFQARIPPALCAVHNFIRIHDPNEILNFNNDTQDLNSGLENDSRGVLAEGPANLEEREAAKVKREEIGNRMWHDYQRLLRDRLVNTMRRQ